MVAFVVLVYVVVVVGGGVLVGQTAAPSLWLSVLATAVVAVGFGPVRSRVTAWSAKVLHLGRMSPYQVLAHFPETATGAYPAAELPVRVVRVLAEGTNAAGAQLWLVVLGRLELAATWPATGNAPDGGARADAPTLGVDRPGLAPVVVVDGARRSLAVRERGELLGALSVVVGEGQELSPVESRLFAGLAAQSGLMLRVAALRAELERQLDAVQHRALELRRARRDLVARQDNERQRLERNIHDGAQQEIIALLVNLRLARTLLDRAPGRAAGLLAGQAAAARATIDTLTTLSRGLYPRLLTDAGPVAALSAAVASGPIPVVITADDLPRYAPEVEAAVYFACLEAVQNAGKHSGATRISVAIGDRSGRNDTTGEVDITIVDDGRGFDPAAGPGNGLSNIHDRIESVRGVVTITSTVGSGTTVRASIPIAAVAGQSTSTSRSAVNRSPVAGPVTFARVAGD